MPTWIRCGIDSIDNTNCRINVGHVKHAVVLAFGFLKKRTDYKTAIEETLIRGGDTDTNAKIVGNLIGALHGVEDMMVSCIRNPLNDIFRVPFLDDGHVFF